MLDFYAETCMNFHDSASAFTSLRSFYGCYQPFSGGP